MSYATVVVGTDGSVTAERAVAAAGEVAAANGCRLVVVTAYGPGPGGATSKGPADRRTAEELAGRGRTVAAEVGATDVVAAAAEGPPADVLLRAAEDNGADLLVVGSLGMSGPARFLLGGVANAVSHGARCDVLLVHTSD